MRIDEKVLGRLAVGYHRTKNLDIIKSIGSSGFEVNKGLYGTGIYLTYDLESQQNSRMERLYGPYIVRSKVNLNDFLIFDEEVAKIVYGKDYTIENQSKKLNIPLTGAYEQWWLLKSREYTSDLARYFIENLYNADIKIKGMVFTGRQDGRVIVAFNRSSVIPFGYTKWSENSFDKTPNWIPFENQIKKIPDEKTSVLLPYIKIFKRLDFELSHVNRHYEDNSKLDPISYIIFKKQIKDVFLYISIENLSLALPTKIKIKGYFSKNSNVTPITKIRNKINPDLERFIETEFPINYVINSKYILEEAKKVIQNIYSYENRYLPFAENFIKKIINDNAVPLKSRKVDNIISELKKGNDLGRDEYWIKTTNIKIKIAEPYTSNSPALIYIEDKDPIWISTDDRAYEFLIKGIKDWDFGNYP